MSCRQENCGKCYENRKGRATHQGHRYCLWHPRRKRPYWETTVKRPDASKLSPAQANAPPTDQFAVTAPGLMEYLTHDKYEDGTPRERSALSVFIEDGWYKLALNDKDLRRSLYVTAESLIEALKALERHLLADTGDWRSWSGGKKKGK